MSVLTSQEVMHERWVRDMEERDNDKFEMPIDTRESLMGCIYVKNQRKVSREYKRLELWEVKAIIEEYREGNMWVEVSNDEYENYFI